VAGYRASPAGAIIPRWAWGLWQSPAALRDGESQPDVVDGFRSRGIPFDNIVAGLVLLKETPGSNEFTKTRFPDPDGGSARIHESTPVS